MGCGDGGGGGVAAAAAAAGRGGELRRKRLRTCAQSAWTTRTMQLWMGIMLGCVVRVGSLASALVKLEGLLPDHPTAKPAVRPINCLG